MIADRFTEKNERSAALGIALAFVSFGCLIAPPFGSVLYSIGGKPAPFIILILMCFIDLVMVFLVIEPTKAKTTRPTNLNGQKLNGTPIWQLFQDPFIAVCSGALIMANVSLSFLEPTIATWIRETMPETPNWQLGIIWLPAFLPHIFGVYITVRILKQYPQYQWLIAVVGLAVDGISCIAVPFTRSAAQLIIPLSTICFGIALIDTSLLPMLGYLVDTRHVSVYGSVYAIADISYSLAYAFGPIIAGEIVYVFGFLVLNIIIFIVSIAYLPVLMMLKKVYAYENLDGNIQQKSITNDEIDGLSTNIIIQNKNSLTNVDAYNCNQETAINNKNFADVWSDNNAVNGYGSIFEVKSSQPTPVLPQSTILPSKNLTSTTSNTLSFNPFDTQW